MTQQTLDVRGVVGLAGGRVAVVVRAPEGLDLQYIYRADMSVYWNPASSRLEDRRADETTPLESLRQIVRALADEYRLGLRAASGLACEGFEESVRLEIEAELR